jgi:hypothetical protein
MACTYFGSKRGMTWLNATNDQGDGRGAKIVSDTDGYVLPIRAVAVSDRPRPMGHLLACRNGQREDRRLSRRPAGGCPALPVGHCHVR